MENGEKVWYTENKACMKRHRYSWRGSSSGRAPAWQAWGPEFKPKYHPKKRKKKKDT
jgi:hypothetical protein